jgi:hypothetical protein
MESYHWCGSVYIKSALAELKYSLSPLCLLLL